MTKAKSLGTTKSKKTGRAPLAVKAGKKTINRGASGDEVAQILAGLKAKVSQQSDERANQARATREALLTEALTEVESKAADLADASSRSLQTQQHKTRAAAEKHVQEVAALTADYKAANEKWGKAITLVESHFANATQSENDGLKELDVAGNTRISGAEKTMTQIRVDVEESKTVVHSLIKKAFTAQQVVQAVTLVLSSQQ